VVLQRISWGGGCEESAFLNSLHDHIRSDTVQKEFLLLAHSCGERYSLQVAEVRKAQSCLGLSTLMPYGAQSLNCRIEKG
jgi:hypothetical protein